MGLADGPYGLLSLIAMDPDNFILFPLIDIALASNDNYLLFSIRVDPPDQWGIIISITVGSADVPLSPIAIDPADHCVCR